MTTDKLTPPADDVREALIEHIQFGSVAAATADSILSDPRFEVRPRGTVTDAEVEAGALALSPRADHWRDYAPTVRRVLEAVARVRLTQ